MFQCSHHVSIALRPRCSLLRTTLFTICHIYTCVISKEAYTDTRCLWSFMYILYNVGGQDEKLWHPCFYVPWLTHFVFDRYPELSLIKLISLIRLIKYFNPDNLYTKPQFHNVTKALSISKNTAAVDMLLLKFKITWSVSLIRWNFIPWRVQKPTCLSLIKCAFGVFSE
jgi:hypothetical protein